MLRWFIALALLALAGVTAWMGSQTAAERGLRLRVYDNTRFTGEPFVDTRVSHVDLGPELTRHPVSIPRQSGVILDGWLYAPRSGRYELEIEASSPTDLKIGGERVVRHRSRTKPTGGHVTLEKGFHRFDLRMRHRRGDATLLVRWRLPSGYMNLEALQPIYLQPSAPAPGPTVPLALRVAPVMFVLLALLLLLAPRLARAVRRLRNDRQYALRVGLGALLLVATVGYRSWDLNGAGETSDEWAYASAGRIYISNIAHGYFESAYWNTNEEHPPIGKYIYGVVSHLSGTDSYGPLRFAAAVMNGLTVLLTYLFGLTMLTTWRATVAGLLLVVLPPFVAHGKVAALDAPSALFFTLGVYLFVRALLATRRQNLWYLGAGVVASLAFCTKFSNVLIFAFMMGAHLASQWRRILRRRTLELPIALYAYPILPLAILLISWPWLWREPFGQLVTTLTHWDYPIREWFLGRFRQPPFYYFPVYTVATTPLPVLIAMVGFVVTLLRRKRFVHGMVFLWFLTPFLWTASALKQDGVRYIYTMYPPLALMAAIGVEALIPRRRWRSAAAAVMVSWVALQAVRVHPYYLDYYSEVVGGTEGAYERAWFDVGWWGEGFDRAVEIVNESAPEKATWDCVGVVTHTCDALREDLTYRSRNPDYVIRGYIVGEEESREGYRELERIEVDGAPIVIIYEREPPDG